MRTSVNDLQGSNHSCMHIIINRNEPVCTVYQCVYYIRMYALIIFEQIIAKN